MKKLSTLLMLLFAVMTRAEPLGFQSQLEGVPGAPPAAMGSGVFRLEGQTLFYDITYTSLSGAPTEAHIHGPFGIVTSLQPVGVLTETFGHYMGSANYGASELGHLLEGRQYVNIHTLLNPVGEVRGNILPVPEPAGLLTAGTLAAGLGILAGKRRRRRAAR